MTAARADNAARDLLARLAEEAELETAPLDEVRTDLARLGIDPERAVRFSRRLAAEAAAPAGGLLAKGLAAEESDREISELENADLDAVRAELSGTAPLAAAHVQRLADKAMSAAAPRRSSRRLWYGIGGAITAIAAAVLIVVALESPENAPLQVALAPDDASNELSRRLEAPDAASRQEVVPQPPMEPAADGATTVTAMSSPPSAPALPKKEIAEPKASAEPEQLSAGAVADRTAEAETSRQPDGIASNFNHNFNGVTLNLGGGASWSFDRESSASQGDVRYLEVAAALILQPELAPERLRQADLGASALASYLPEVARSRDYRRYIALVTLRHADGTSFDAALLQSTQEFDRSSGTTAAASTEPAGVIPPTPTLNDLLGAEAGHFMLRLITPPKSQTESGTTP